MSRELHPAHANSLKREDALPSRQTGLGEGEITRGWAGIWERSILPGIQWMTVRQYQVGIFCLTTSRGITIQAQIFSRPGNTPASGKILSGNLKMTPAASFWVTDGACRPSSSLAIFSMQCKKEAAFNRETVPTHSTLS